MALNGVHGSVNHSKTHTLYKWRNIVIRERYGVGEDVVARIEKKDAYILRSCRGDGWR